MFVTDNTQQAARVAGEVGFLAVDPRLGGGVLVEFGIAQRIFTRPADARTHDYIARHHD